MGEWGRAAGHPLISFLLGTKEWGSLWAWSSWSLYLVNVWILQWNLLNSQMKEGLNFIPCRWKHKYIATTIKWFELHYKWLLVSYILEKLFFVRISELGSVQHFTANLWVLESLVGGFVYLWTEPTKLSVYPQHPVWMPSWLLLV